MYAASMQGVQMSDDASNELTGDNCDPNESKPKFLHQSS